MENKKENNKFFITTPIYYASGNLHLGHAYTSIACDVLARWNRNLGKEVFFLTGSDEHGQKVAKKAEENKLSPKEYTDKIVSNFKNTMKILDINYDYFIRTTQDEHKEFVKKMLLKSYENGDIYKGKYEGLYCIDCEQYYREEDLIDGKICNVHKKEVTNMSEENYFFKLSSYQEKLLDFYKKNPEFLSSKTKSQEIINRVQEGLLDISISRNKNTLSWGIELPFDKEHVTYVWYDALFNYLSALKINDKLDYWPANVHVVGKDIMWFHKVFWPAFLMSCGYELPKKVFAHGWWTVDGEKMGKSMGNVIDPVEICNKYGSDEFKYFLLSVGTFGDDLDFSLEKFSEKINNELNNDLGNLVSRVHAMTQKYFDSKIPSIKTLTKEEEILLDKLNIFEKFNTNIQNLRFNHSLDLLFDAIRETNAYINKTSPWKIDSKERLAQIIYILNYSVYLFAEYIDCYMPNIAEKIRKQYNFKKIKIPDFNYLKIFKENHSLGIKDNLFKKIILEKNEQKNNKNFQSNKNEIKFSNLNLKVGKIVDIKQHPSAEKLYIEKIDFGNGIVKQIVSGLKGYYELEELLNKKVVVIYNLKPTKLRGEISEGMLLVAENEKENTVGILETNCEVGENLFCIGNKQKANCENQIKIDDFFKIKLISDGKNIYYDCINEKNLIVIDNNENSKLIIDKNVCGNIR